MVASNAEMYFLNSCKTYMAQVICVDFGESEFLNIHIFNWYRTLYSARSSNFRHLDFIRVTQMISCSLKQDVFLKGILTLYKVDTDPDPEREKKRAPDL